MYRVNIIVQEIVERMDVTDEHIRFIASKWSLLHDIPEIVTGDIATPTKRAMRQAVPDSDPVKRIELSLDEEYRNLYEEIKAKYPIVFDIVKVADLIEAIDFLNVEGMGKHALSVNITLREALDEKIESSDSESFKYAAVSVFKEVCCSLDNKPISDGAYPLS